MIILILHQFPAFNSVRLLLSPSNYFLSTDFHNCKVFSVPQIFSWILAHILGFLYSQTISSISIICCCIFPHPPPLPPLLFSSWGWTGRSVVLRFMGLQTVRHDWATELNWTSFYYLWCNGPSLSVLLLTSLPVIISYLYKKQRHDSLVKIRELVKGVQKIQLSSYKISNFWRCNVHHQFSSVRFSRSVMSDSLQPHELQHARPPCPSPTPRVHPNSCVLSRWCHPTISSSVIPFSSCPPNLPASGSFPMSQLFTWGGQSIGVSALASVLPRNTQDWSPLEWTGWISL